MGQRAAPELEVAMETIRIPNQATYSPVSLLELAVVAPWISKAMTGFKFPGRVLGAASIGVYGLSALQDWGVRGRVRPVDFRREFGANIRKIPDMPTEAREAEVRVLVERLNSSFVPTEWRRRELATRVDRHLTELIAGITDQRVVTSTEVRGFSLAALFFPFALGATDPVSGDVAILRDTGPFEGHVLAHEFAHRKGYLKELHAQLLAYIALTGSGDPELAQSSLCDRLLRQLSTLAGDDPHALHARIRESGLRPELLRWFLRLRPEPGSVERNVGRALRTFYDMRMKMTGQNGIEDYDRNFTAVLWAMEQGAGRRGLPDAGRVGPQG